MAKDMEVLAKEIGPLSAGLKRSGQASLAEEIRKNWRQTALEYSKKLNTWAPVLPLEQELYFAFAKELERLDIDSPVKEKVLDSIEKNRILQTALHLCASSTPRMFCINWLGSLGVKEKDFYIVAMFSGIPFSNRSRPGRINKNKDSVNLFPSNMQDALVYRSDIPEKLVTEVANLPEKLKKLLPKAKAGASYTKWALTTSKNIDQNILGNKNSIYLDINEVVAEYLLQVLPKPHHVLHKIFFNEKIRKEFVKTFPKEILFYGELHDGKYATMENFTLAGDFLVSKNRKISLENPKALLEEIRMNKLCPGLLTGFLSLAFLNHFKCFGSFAQVEYLPAYQKKLAKLKWLKDFKVSVVPTANLTTGVFPEHKELYPVDIILGEKFEGNSKRVLGEFILPMQEVLFENYFTGGERKKTEHASAKSNER